MAMRLNDRFSKRQNTLSLVFGVLFFLSYYIEEVFQIDGFFKGFTFLFPLGAMALSLYWTGKELKKRQERWKQYLILGVAMKVGVFIETIIFFNFSFCLFFITIAFAGIGFLLPAVNYGITSAADESDRGFIVSLYGATRFLGVALGPIIFG